MPKEPKSCDRDEIMEHAERSPYDGGTNRVIHQIARDPSRKNRTALRLAKVNRAHGIAVMSCAGSTRHSLAATRRNRGRLFRTMCGCAAGATCIGRAIFLPLLFPRVMDPWESDGAMRRQQLDQGLIAEKCSVQLVHMRGVEEAALSRLGSHGPIIREQLLLHSTYDPTQDRSQSDPFSLSSFRIRSVFDSAPHFALQSVGNPFL